LSRKCEPHRMAFEPDEHLNQGGQKARENHIERMWCEHASDTYIMYKERSESAWETANYVCEGRRAEDKIAMQYDEGRIMSRRV